MLSGVNYLRPPEVKKLRLEIQKRQDYRKKNENAQKGKPTSLVVDDERKPELNEILYGFDMWNTSDALVFIFFIFNYLFTLFV